MPKRIPPGVYPKLEDEIKLQTPETMEPLQLLALNYMAKNTRGKQFEEYVRMLGLEATLARCLIQQRNNSAKRAM